MLITRKKVSAAESLETISNLLLASFIVAVLYFARELLIPLALAALLTFLLAPLVTKLHRWFGRVGAVLLVVLMMFCATGFVGWVLTRQAVDLATQLPNYKENISAKLLDIKLPQTSSMKGITDTIEALKDDVRAVLERGGDSISDLEEGYFGYEPAIAVEPVEVEATPVEVVSGKDERLEFVQVVLAPIFGSLVTAGLVVLLLIFMLLRREDLRNRFLRLVGQGRISATSRAMDEAGASVARYLLMQLVVNVTYGIPVAIGLYFIGVPNAVLWGALCTVLRFIPYVGPWIGALFPILMSLTVSPGWIPPILTITLFVVLELISNNIAEPLLYGSSTGVTPIALIVAALGWTWLWGPVGLVLATPITVCLVVMGRHIPRLAFFSIVLSDERPLTPAEECYQRIQRPGDSDEFEFVDSYLKDHSEEELYDEVLVPVLSAAEADYRGEMISKDELDAVHLRIAALVEDVDLRLSLKEPSSLPEQGNVPKLFCLPASARRDELAGAMAVNLLHRRGLAAQVAPSTLVSGELVGWVEEAGGDTILLTGVSPTTLYQVRYLCLKLHTRMPELRIVVALCDITGRAQDARLALHECGADEIVTSIREGAARIVVLASATPAKPVLELRG
jgi:predicted PurR-regulated permease PerM